MLYKSLINEAPGYVFTISYHGDPTRLKESLRQKLRVPCKPLTWYHSASLIEWSAVSETPGGTLKWGTLDRYTVRVKHFSSGDILGTSSLLLRSFNLNVRTSFFVQWVTLSRERPSVKVNEQRKRAFFSHQTSSPSSCRSWDEPLTLSTGGSPHFKKVLTSSPPGRFQSLPKSKLKTNRDRSLTTPFYHFW